MRLRTLAAMAVMTSGMVAGPAAAGHAACDGADVRQSIPTERVGLHGNLRLAVWNRECVGASIDHDTITCEERILHESVGRVTVAACPGTDAEGPQPLAGAWVSGLGS